MQSHGISKAKLMIRRPWARNAERSREINELPWGRPFRINFSHSFLWLGGNNASSESQLLSRL
jgi:hypothetical protein